MMGGGLYLSGGSSSCSSDELKLFGIEGRRDVEQR